MRVLRGDAALGRRQRAELSEWSDEPEVRRWGWGVGGGGGGGG